MNNDINNMDDLFDDSIGKSLRRLGFTFPRTAADFRIIENQLANNKLIQPDFLKDPYAFLGKRAYGRSTKPVQEEGALEYSKNLAQAARDGKVISDEVKKKMAEDKLKANQKKK